MSPGELRQFEDQARSLDEADALAGFRERFSIPTLRGGEPGRASVYLCGNSLGCMPRDTGEAVERLMADWAALGVDGHFEARDGWYRYHELVRDDAAMLVGGLAHEVVVMNSLTVNLHLMLRSFYRPEGARWKALLDWPCFPSDIYAVKSHLRTRGLDGESGIVWARPQAGEHTLREDDIIGLMDAHRGELALVLLAGVNFFTGQRYDLGRIASEARARGIVIGYDLAHAAGNVPLRMHEWGADFAVWCNYKYLNSGPGAVAGCFVHERWTRGLGADEFAAMPRYEGWWGNDPSSRFEMGPDFTPIRSADAWQLSNPPIFALAPVKASYAIFREAGLDRLRGKSVALTGFLETMIRAVTAGRPGAIEIITPEPPDRRGAQLSLLVHGENPGALLDRLTGAGIVCDFREPNALRIAPTPLYNTFMDCWRFAGALGDCLED
jgi:kynureninase